MNGSLEKDGIIMSSEFVDYCHLHHSMSCVFEPERKEPPKLNSVEASCMGLDVVMDAWNNGGIETGRYQLILFLTGPESLSGIGPSTSPVFHALKLLEFVETGGETPQGAVAGYYKLEAQGFPPHEMNNFKDTSFHQGKSLYVERTLFEDKILAPIYMMDIHDHELKNTIGVVLNFK